jgi:CheY-like chemotaxis protein
MALILVVDDSQDTLILVKDFLIGLGHTCRLAASGRQALDVLKAEDFDLIISDYQMENGDGLWLLNELKNELMALSCIMITADHTINKDQFISAGASAFCPKPINWPQLEKEIHRLLPLA